MTRLRLPGRGFLPQTGALDAVHHYHDAVLGFVLRQRLRWVLGALPRYRVDRLLEVGCGSGIFLYELSRHARKTFGLDLHPHLGAVSKSLAEDHLTPPLVQGDAAGLPFDDGAFDVVILVSVLEFVRDPLACVTEATRVLRKGGWLIFVTPRQLRWADALYRRISGIDPEADFQGGRARVQEMLRRQLPGARRLKRPFWLPGHLAPYELVVLSKTSGLST